MKTKVKDLIKKLQQYEENSEILFTMADGCCGDIEFLDFIDVDHWEKSPNCEEKVIIEFNPLWFMDTCITGGVAKRAALNHKKNVYGDDWKPGDPNQKIFKKEISNE